MTDNNPAKSSTPQPQKTVDESNSGISQDPKTVFELNSQTLTNISLPAKDPLEGKTIGDNNRYLLQTLLGRGGMSHVYKALDTKFEDRIVAVKLMNNYTNANNKHSIKRFMAEVKAISSLKHPNIIQIFDYGITSDEDPFWSSPFYVMEYLPGQTLQNLLQENKVVPLKSILKIISQICAGLKEAHQKGIIHRDLKPDNIFLINGSGLGEIIKILDFGIAKNISSEGTTQTKLTQEGAFIGTYRYASPEQCRGLANIDQRTDIYSLGVILYEAICGKSPYDLGDDFSNSQADWMVCHIKVPPKPLKEQPGCQNLSDELVNIVMKCLAKSPENRFSDIENLLNALTKGFLVGMDLNNESVITEKSTHQPEKKGNRTKTKLEVEPIYSETVLDETNNQFSEDLNNSQNISVGLLTAVMAFIIAMVGTIGYLGMFFLLEQPSKISHKSLTYSINADDNPKNINLLLDELSTQYQQENYQDCYELAIENPNRDNFLIQEWIGKCGLIAAKIKAELNSFSGAIALAETIPDTVSNYQEIQDNINIWSGKILDYATKLYHQGKLDEAVKVTQIVSDNSNLKSKVPELISQWKQEESKHKTTIDNAQNLLNKGQWSAAKEEVEKIPSHFVFWQEAARPILERANQKINELAAAQRRNRRVQRKPPRARVKRTRVRRQRQPTRVQPKKTKPLPSLRERLNNAPLMDDRTLKERLKRN